ncbi:MAG: hypothetical protein PHX18_05530 [Candidatus Gastranaerophilales bacterium]|nr:hypothetical protein [Candidatus Gastranaerophilales bacterium]
MQQQELKFNPEAKTLSDLFAALKKIYFNEVDEAKISQIQTIVREKGYLPYSHQHALEELTPFEIITGLEAKFRYNKVFNDNGFDFTDLSPVKRAGYDNSSWIQQEQHEIKLINLCALGNGMQCEFPASFIDILTQILILPSCGEGRLSATAYFVPFHPREFGCAYLPKSSEVSEALEDKFVLERLNLDAKAQIQLALAFAQLAGHPVMYDVLPQTGRFSKAVLSNPYIARWFDIAALINEIEAQTDKLNCSKEVKTLLKSRLNGDYVNIPDNLSEEYEQAEKILLAKKKELSNNMTKKENQRLIHKKVKSIVCELIGRPQSAMLHEEDITNQNDVTSTLISQGLWPAPGGAWNSCGVPVFDKMSEGASYPVCRHFNIDKEDVTNFANLDCQTPYYFVNLEDGTYNQEVIDYYINALHQLQEDYNFDGFRVDHIDHIVDRVSQKDECPISYRAPKKVLGEANRSLKSKVPHFAALAEYMLWDGFLKEYHQDMAFDLLWGNDIISQSDKSVENILKDLQTLEEYNSSLEADMPKLSILKTYNNQDGEFEAIDQFPGQLTEKGALFKWLKYKLLIGGAHARRPILYIDGDESFTKTGCEHTIGSEVSLKRERNDKFFAKFNAVSEFAKTCQFCREGKTELLRADEDGFVAWITTAKGRSESLLVVANEQYPTEKVRSKDENGCETVNIKGGVPVVNKTLDLNGKKVKYEFVYDKQGSFVKTRRNDEIELFYDQLKPSRFRIYLVE